MRPLLLSAAAALLVLSACTDEPEPISSPRPDDPTVTRYVALGDSYTSGPGIDPADEKSGGCERSKVNYPRLVAKRLGADLEDASCGRATTIDVLSAPQSKAGATIPQVEAITADADLVSVGIGANNGFATPMFLNCLYSEDTDDDCPAWSEDDLPGILTAAQVEVGAVLDQIERRAPDATVILVGYLSLAAGGPCSAMPTSEDALDLMRSAEQDLESMLESTARQHDAAFVPMGELSRKHGPCSKDPWVNGVKSARNDGDFLHPRKAGMIATADAVVDAVREARAQG